MSEKEKIEFGNFSYPQQIKTPTELGMGDKGTMSQLKYNVAGMIDYINVLVTGNTPASKQGGGPIGDAFFIDTSSKCLYNGTPKPRHFYINNIPSGKIPFLSGKTNLKLNDFRGLIPGIIEDISDMNPENLMKSFGDTKLPTCNPKTYKIVDSNGDIYKETRYISDDDSSNFTELTDSKIKCNPNSHLNTGNTCCITSEDERKKYSNDDLLLCNKPSSVEAFKNSNNNPYHYFNNKKIEKQLIMFIIFIVLVILIISK